MLKDAVTAQTVPPPEAVPLSMEAWASNDLRRYGRGEPSAKGVGRLDWPCGQNPGTEARRPLTRVDARGTSPGEQDSTLGPAPFGPSAERPRGEPNALARGRCNSTRPLASPPLPISLLESFVQCPVLSAAARLCSG